MFNDFIVLSADIIDSKKHLINIESLNNSLKELNNAFDSDLMAYFKLYRGDEIQCVLLPTSNIIKVVRNLRYAINPLKVRIGIGKGTIDTEVDLRNNKLKNTDPWENNGQAFFLARESLKLLTNKRIYKKKPRTYFLSNMDDKYPKLNSVNSLLNLYDIVLESWADSQWNSVHAYEKYNNLEEAALHLGKTYQSIQRSVSKANWDEVKVCEEQINQLISQL